MTQIAIKYVNPAKEGKKYGSIKDSSGGTYWVAKEMVGQFQPNTTVDVALSQQTWGQNQVQVVSHVLGGGTAAPTPTAAAAPAATHSNGHYSDGKDGQIFITGVMQRMMGSGKYDTQDIPLIAQALVGAWNEHIKGKL